MAQKGDYKALPTLTKDITYATWKKEISIWQLFTSLEKKKQAPAIFLLSWRSRQRYSNGQSSQRISRKTNPLDANGEISHCHTCGSIFYWSYACPDSYESRDPVKEIDGGVQIQLLEETMETFIDETLSMAVLDSGCTKTVCGETWLNCYLKTLSDEDTKLLHVEDCNSVFKFGNSKLIKSNKKRLQFQQLPVLLIRKLC